MHNNQNIMKIFFLLSVQYYCLSLENFETLCGDVFDIGKSGGVMYSGEVWHDTYYSSNLTCTVTLKTTEQRRILLTWISFNVEKTSGNCRDLLQIYDGPTRNEEKMLNSRNQCGKFLEYNNTKSTGPELTLTLTSDFVDDNNDFAFVYTSFTEKGKGR